MNIDYTTVFVIREVSTGKLIKFGAKCAWATSSAAKNAFALHAKSIYRSWLDDGTEHTVYAVVGDLVYLVDPFYDGLDAENEIWPFLEDELEALS